MYLHSCNCICRTAIQTMTGPIAPPAGGSELFERIHIGKCLCMEITFFSFTELQKKKKKSYNVVGQF